MQAHACVSHRVSCLLSFVVARGIRLGNKETVGVCIALGSLHVRACFALPFSSKAARVGAGKQ